MRMPFEFGAAITGFSRRTEVETRS